MANYSFKFSVSYTTEYLSFFKRKNTYIIHITTDFNGCSQEALLKRVSLHLKYVEQNQKQEREKFYHSTSRVRNVRHREAASMVYREYGLRVALQAGLASQLTPKEPGDPSIFMREILF